MLLSRKFSQTQKKYVRRNAEIMYVQKFIVTHFCLKFRESDGFIK